MGCSKERVGVGILQPAQGHNIDKEGQTETSVGGGGGRNGERGRGGRVAEPEPDGREYKQV